MKHILMLGGLILLLSTAINAQVQTIKALLNSHPSSIELQDNTYISYGCVEDNYILLQEIPIAKNGYIEFSFSNLKATDDIVIGFENSANTNQYYRFEYNTGGTAVHQYNDSRQVLSVGNNNNLFKVLRCGDNISFFEADGRLVQSFTAPKNTKLWAKIQAYTADDVLLEATFNPDYTDCPKCADVNGTSLFTSDLEFTGLTTSVDNEVSIQTNVPLTPGTHFTIAETVYEAGAAANVSTNSWYAGDEIDGSSIASHKITYTGTTTIPSGSTICFTLPSTGLGDAALSTNFLVNGNYSNDFCVEDTGNRPGGSVINMSNATTALFLLQGSWTFSEHRGLFHGQYLDAYQHNGNWVAAHETAPSGSGRSRLPMALACQEPPTTLPLVVCTINSGSLVTEDSDIIEAVHEKNEAVSSIRTKVYPNPFKQSFSLDLQLSTAEEVRIALINATGQEVYRLPSKTLQIGTYTFDIQPEQNLYSGLYFLRVQTKQSVIIEKIVQQNNTFQTPNK